MTNDHSDCGFQLTENLTPAQEKALAKIAKKEAEIDKKKGKEGIKKIRKEIGDILQKNKLKFIDINNYNYNKKIEKQIQNM